MMSATVRMSRSFSRSSVCTVAAKLSIVLGSPRSRLCATVDMSRWCSTSQATVSVCAEVRPKRGPSLRAMRAPATEWSSGRPLAMSCRNSAR
ncbi:hypothetical protein D3C87_1992220 [compost metagenome]